MLIKIIVLHLFVNKDKYETMEMPELYIVDSRMHLTSFQVMQLLPALQNFVHTGNLTVELPELLEDDNTEDGIIENLLYDAEWMDLDDMEKSIEFMKMKYAITRITEAQQFIMDKFNSSLNHDPCIHKHRRSKAWFQTMAISWYPVSDQTIKALVKKGLLYQQDSTHWRLTPQAEKPTN